jgi:hypothetical protein
MKYYKLKEVPTSFRFSLQEIDYILKYRFNAEKCSNALIQKQNLEVGIKDVTYHITDKEILGEIRTPKEVMEIQEHVNGLPELGLEIRLIDRGEEYFIHFEFDENGRVVYTSFIGSNCNYLYDETIILRGNEPEITLQKMLPNALNEDGRKQIREAVEKCNKLYIELLKEHGYID